MLRPTDELWRDLLPPTPADLSEDEAHRLLARLACQVSPFSTVDTVGHVRAVASIASHAKRQRPKQPSGGWL